MRFHGAALDAPVVLRTILGRGLELFPDAPCLATQDGQWSWRELDDLSTAYARNLLALGLVPGDRVASLLPNVGPLFIHYMGTIKAGLVAVPLNYRYTHFEIDHALEVSGANAIVYQDERQGDIDQSALGGALAVKVTNGEGGADGTVPFASLLVPADGLPEPAEPAPDAPAFIFFTSGSTGPAKGVTHTHETLGWLFASAARSLQISPDDIVMAASSCSHAGGFTVTFAAWAEAAMVVGTRVGDPHLQLDLMRTWKPTALLMLPAALFTLERDIHAFAEDFGSLRLVVSGGDKVPEQLEKEFMSKTGLPIDELYGMTEIGISHLNPSSGLVKLGTVGRTCNGYMAEIRDEDGNVLPVGEEGRLWVKFPGTMALYWNRPDATDEVTGDDGWFDTGDVMRADEQGYLTFCGRKKQIIVHDGSNIFPQEVEDALLAHDAVELVGVIGIHDTVHGENVRAYVELRDGVAAPDARDLIAFARERVGYKAPEEIVILDTMPLNATGKVDRVTLKRQAAERHEPA